MSGAVAIAEHSNARALSCAERTKSIDAISEFDHLSVLTNGEIDDFSVGELLLSNGESYSGSLYGNVSEGHGTYMWYDGCVYEGEWRRGIRNGYGKIKWPSGAVYEGDFSGGYIHGTGKYTRSDKLTYKGRWRLNLKHGLGYQVYPNGDTFEGSWMQGTPEGPGKYTWTNGNVYVGNMKGGIMSGKGTLTWVNGDSYEGNWLNGMMHGFGVYNWSDGGSYVGTWTFGLKDGKGTFYPRGSSLPSVQEIYLNALRKRGLLPDLKKQNQVRDVKVPENQMSSHVSSDKLAKGNMLKLEQSNRRNVSLERRWSLEVSIEKVIAHDSALGLAESVPEGTDKEVDAMIPILEREYMQGVLISEVVLNNMFSSMSRRARRLKKKLAKETNRPGEAIIKGHRSYDLMLSLQLGIRYTVGKITPIPAREVRASDFRPKASFWMNFPKEGSQLTPTHQSEDFKWKDYFPMVFRNLRELFKIDAADYMMSICGNDTLRELSSPGKSGSVFFLSQDDRFMIKTLRLSEVKHKIHIPLSKIWHAGSSKNASRLSSSCETKFFGLHRIKTSSGQKFRFVVMGNMFCTELRIHRRFDLKGSSLGRSSDKIEIDENTTLKDLDLNYSFYLEPSWRESLLKQIEIDSKFLVAKHIMDYSLLLGVHYRAPQHLRPFKSCGQSRSVDGLAILAEEDPLEDEASYPQGLVLVPRGADDNTVVVGSHMRGSRLRASSAGDEEVDLLLPGTARLQIQLGVNMPSRAEQISGKREKAMFHEVYDVVLYLGIIDILQDYNMTKKIEHAYKSLQFDSLSISAVDPTFYSQRFLEFIQKVFPPNAMTG